MMDTIFLLDEIHIKAEYLRKEAIGQNVLIIDSILKEENRVESLPLLLSKHTGLFIKSNGYSGISSISLRGNSSSQTNIIWNNIPIHSPLLGMSDLSGITNHSFSEISIYPNGKPCFLGNHSAGGSLVLKSDLHVRKPFEAVITQSLGNYNLRQSSIQIKAKKGRWSSYLNPFLHSFKDIYNTNRKGISLGALYRLNDKNTFSFHTWIQDEESQQIGTIFPVLDNIFVRSVINWKHKFKNGQLQSDISYVKERQQYYGVYSFSVFRNSSQITKLLFGSFLFSAGYSLSDTKADSEGFLSSKKQFRALAFIDGQGQAGKRIRYQVNIKNGFSDNKGLPLIASLGLDFSVLKDNLVVKAFIGNKYRQPSLNDLYWDPGGNIDLKSENGYASELSLIYQKKKDDFPIKTSQTVFVTKTDDKIIWLPISSIMFEPVNISKTKTSGIESRIEVKKNWNKKHASSTLLYTYTVAKNKSKISSFDRSYNKQLIYVPLHKISIVSRFGISDFTFFYMINYNSKTFISKDNEHYIDAYLINDLRLKKIFNIYDNQLSALMGINNIWNTSYEIVKGFLMPGRQIYLSITYQLF